MDEQARYELSERLAEVLGPAPAGTLMASLPPSRWDQLATKQDLERFATKEDLERFATKVELAELRSETLHRFALLDERLEAMEHRITAAFRGELTAAITAQTRTMTLGLLGTVLAMGSFMLAATGLA